MSEEKTPAPRLASVKLLTRKKRAEIVDYILANREASSTQIADKFGIERQVVYRILNAMRIQKLIPMYGRAPVVFKPEVEPQKDLIKADELLEIKATLLAQEKIIKYLEGKLGLGNASSV